MKKFMSILLISVPSISLATCGQNSERTRSLGQAVL